MAQFVPVKLDVSSPEYRQWSADHKSEGNSIPKLFIVRADGETLYGKSGSLTGEKLPAMLMTALRHSGKILTPRDAKLLTDSMTRFDEFKEQGDLPRAIKALSRVKKIGMPGKIESYASLAAKLNELANELTQTVAVKLAELQTALDDAESGEETQVRLNTMMAFLDLQNDYGSLQSVKPQLSAFQKTLSKKDHSTLFREAKLIEGAMTAKTKSSKTRAIQKLKALVESTEFDEVKTLATETLEKIQAKEAE